MRFCDKLPNLRKEKNLSQEQLADRLDVSRQAVSKWESGASYPDMDKFLQMCKILDCTLNDIMDDGAFGEEVPQPKKNTGIEVYVKSFLEYITRVYNMWCSFNFKTKLKCLFEILFMAAVCSLTAFLIYRGLDDLTLAVLDPLYHIKAVRFLLYFLEKIYLITLTALAVLSWFHLFKIRYLDYYVTVTDPSAQKSETEEPLDDVKLYEGSVKNAKIIIRDPKHSSPVFFNFLGKIALFFIKMFVAMILALTAFAFLAAAVAAGISAFNMVYSSVFFWMFATCVGASGICFCFIWLCYNFIFSLPQKFKALLIVFSAALALTGICGGLTTAKLFSFARSEAVIPSVSEEIVLENTDENFELISYSGPVSYIVDKNLNNKVVLDVSRPEYESLDVEDIGGGRYAVYTNEDALKIYHLVLEDLRNGSLRSYYGGTESVKINVKVSEETYRAIMEAHSEDNEDENY